MKKCVVPNCNNNSDNSPKKLFLYAPTDLERRSNWLIALNVRDIPYHSYVCEDHFELEEDMENYMYYKIMKNVPPIRLKPGVVPHIFHCQTGLQPTASGTIEKVFLKRQQQTLQDDSSAKKTKISGSDVNIKSESTQVSFGNTQQHPVQQITLNSKNKWIQVNIKPKVRTKSTQCNMLKLSKISH